VTDFDKDKFNAFMVPCSKKVAEGDFTEAYEFGLKARDYLEKTSSSDVHLWYSHWII
jgi:hypothetical protein